MLDIFARLQRQNVTISYQPTNLGFVGRPGGLRMAVTVGMGGLTHQIYFIGPIMRFFGGNFAGQSGNTGIREYLTSEDMVAN